MTNDTMIKIINAPYFATIGGTETIQKLNECVDTLKELKLPGFEITNLQKSIDLFQKWFNGTATEIPLQTIKQIGELLSFPHEELEKLLKNQHNDKECLADLKDFFCQINIENLHTTFKYFDPNTIFNKDGFINNVKKWYQDKIFGGNLLEWFVKNVGTTLCAVADNVTNTANQTGSTIANNATQLVNQTTTQSIHRNEESQSSINAESVLLGVVLLASLQMSAYLIYKNKDKIRNSTNSIYQTVSERFISARDGIAGIINGLTNRTRQPQTNPEALEASGQEMREQRGSESDNNSVDSTHTLIDEVQVPRTETQASAASRLATKAKDNCVVQ